MFDKILIANRGEIACRVIKTARRLGIRTVAVYSEADRDARHVGLVDEAICIGPPPSRESYLVIDNLLAACRQTGAEAVFLNDTFYNNLSQIPNGVAIHTVAPTATGSNFYSHVALLALDNIFSYNLR